MKCPLCKGKETFLFHNKVWVLKNANVLRCKRCDITFLAAPLRREKEEELYKKYNKYIKARGVIRKTDPKELHRESKSTAQKRYEIIKHYFAKAKVVLEIGSSTGAFLQLLKNRERYAIEPANDNREFSKKFVKESYPDIADVPKDKKFDIICMFHTFEHMRKPLEFLKKCKAHLKKNGIVLIEVPCIQDPLISVYDCRAYKDFYFQPTHPFVYSVKSLEYVFSKAGLSRKDVIFYQRYGLDNHLTWLSKGKPSGDKNCRDPFGRSFEYKRVLETTGKTDTLFYIAKNEV